MKVLAALLLLFLCCSVFAHLDTECATQELWEMRQQTFGSQAIQEVGSAGNEILHYFSNFLYYSRGLEKAILIVVTVLVMIHLYVTRQFNQIWL